MSARRHRVRPAPSCTPHQPLLLPLLHPDLLAREKTLFQPGVRTSQGEDLRARDEAGCARVSGICDRRVGDYCSTQCCCCDDSLAGTRGLRVGLRMDRARVPLRRTGVPGARRRADAAGALAPAEESAGGGGPSLEAQREVCDACASACIAAASKFFSFGDPWPRGCGGV